MIPKIKPIHNGAVTQIHDQAILSVNFKIKKIKNKTVQKLKPPPPLLFTDIFLKYIFISYQQ